MSEGSLKIKSFNDAIVKAVEMGIKVILVHDESSCKFPSYAEYPKEIIEKQVFNDVAVPLQPQYEREAWQSIAKRIFGLVSSTPSYIDIFLSHRQATGQGIAMVLHGGLLKTIPTLQIFLDVKSEFELSHLPELVDKTKLFIFILTENIFASEYCYAGKVLYLFHS